MVYRPTARVLTVLELLQAHGRLSGVDLARRLEVDVRTVRNYVETLRDLGIPIEAERGRHGAYRLRPGYKLPPLIFTEDEALALTLSLLLARESGVSTAEAAFAGLLAKVMRVLPEATRDRVRAVERTVIFERDPFPTATGTGTVSILSAAVQARRRVRIRYRSARAEETERAFDPYGVVFHEGAWYTIGHCHLRHGERLFRLDRVLEVEPREDEFVPPSGFDPLAAVQRALRSVPNRWRVDVWLRTTMPEARRRLQLPRAYLEEQDDGVRLRGGVDDLHWLALRLAGLGVPLIIDHPTELRAVLRDYALVIARYAEQSATPSPD